MPGRSERADPGGLELAHLVAVLGEDAGLRIRRGSDGHIRGQVERHGQHEAEVVIGVLADEVHTAGSAKDAHPLGRAVEAAEMFDHELRRDARNAISSRKAPQTTMERPE